MVAAMVNKEFGCPGGAGRELIAAGRPSATTGSNRWRSGNATAPAPTQAASADHIAVLVMLAWPRNSCTSRTSTPSLINAYPAPWRSMCGWIASPIRPPRLPCGRCLHRIDRQRTAAFGLEHPRAVGCLPHLPERAQVIPGNRVRAGPAALGPSDGQRPAIEVEASQRSPTASDARSRADRPGASSLSRSG